MPPNPDADLERGYYVYLHRSNDDESIFYVGKGKGKRAYQEDRRNPNWYARVEKLRKGYSVEILAKDLTEEEAYDLECEQIQKYGCSHAGGSLTNVTYGGSLESGEATRISLVPKLPEPPGGFKPSQYRRISVEEKRELAAAVHAKMREFYAVLQPIMDEICDKELEETDGESLLDNDIHSLKECSRFTLKRKKKYDDFCWDIEQFVDSIEYEMPRLDVSKEKPEIMRIINEAHAFLRPILDRLKIPDE